MFFNLLAVIDVSFYEYDEKILNLITLGSDPSTFISNCRLLSPWSTSCLINKILQIENQKKALEKKDKEIETITKQNSGMRETIERLDREKLLLNTKLKNALKLNSKANNKDPKGYTDTQIYTQVYLFINHHLLFKFCDLR